MGFKLEKKKEGEKTGVFVEKGKRLATDGGVGEWQEWGSGRSGEGPRTKTL